MKRDQHLSNGTIIGGIIVGAALSAATAYLLSNKGRPLRKSLLEGCNSLSCQAQDIAEQIAEHSSHFSDEVSRRLFNGTKRRSNDQLNWVIGGLGVAALGITAVAYLSREENHELRDTLLHTFQNLTDKTSEFAGDIQETVHDYAENIEDNVTCWVKRAQRFLDSVNHCAKTAAAHVGSKSRDDSLIDRAVDWAAFGFKLYQSLKR